MRLPKAETGSAECHDISGPTEDGFWRLLWLPGLFRYYGVRHTATLFTLHLQTHTGKGQGIFHFCDFATEHACSSFRAFSWGSYWRQAPPERGGGPVPHCDRLVLVLSKEYHGFLTTGAAFRTAISHYYFYFWGFKDKIYYYGKKLWWPLPILTAVVH